MTLKSEIMLWAAENISYWLLGAAGTAKKLRDAASILREVYYERGA